MSVYACSDLHGNLTLWNNIKAFLQPEDKLFYLGDATDRGPDGWQILKEMLADSRITYIAGNHDIMLADRICNPNSYRVASLHHMNGGQPTWEKAENDPDATSIAWQIRKLPLSVVYENTNGFKVYMSHSGSTSEDPQDLIWDRAEYMDTNKPLDYDVVVHGHTTIPHLIKDLSNMNHFLPEDRQRPVFEWEGGALWYTNWRCDIDCCTIATGMTVLLNLDTFDEEIFQVDQPSE